LDSQDTRGQKRTIVSHTLVTPNDFRTEALTQVIDIKVARGGIEPPTRGFSVPCLMIFWCSDSLKNELNQAL